MAGWQRVQVPIRAALTFGIVVHVGWPLLLLAGAWWFAALYGLLVLGDALVAVRTLRRFKRPRLAFFVPLYPVFTAAYAIPLLILMLTRRRVKWKERAFA